jgi:hypothetical protein
MLAMENIEEIIPNPEEISQQENEMPPEENAAPALEAVVEVPAETDKPTETAVQPATEASTQMNGKPPTVTAVGAPVEPEPPMWELTIRMLFTDFERLQDFTYVAHKLKLIPDKDLGSYLKFTWGLGHQYLNKLTGNE